MKNVTEGYVRFGIWALQLFLLNLYWMIGVILGLGLFGFFPATAALFSVLRKNLSSTDELPLFKLFWQSYKKDFMKTNALGILISLVGAILLINLSVLQQLSYNVLHMSLTIFTFIILIIYLCTLLFLFPVFVQFDLKALQYVKFAFILAIGKPLQTILLFGALAITFLLYWYIPGLIPVFGVSLLCLVIMKIASLSFSETVEKEEIPSLTEPYKRPQES